jgi:hypothetical protein
MSPVGAASRRSRKDAALDQLHYLGTFAHQSEDWGPVFARRARSSEEQLFQTPAAREGAGEEDTTTTTTNTAPALGA